MIVDSGFHFDRWLKKELFEHNMTQKALEEKSGVSSSRLSHYMSRGELPTLRTLNLILDALDMHMEFVQNE